jgi:hypothetical protein
MSGTTCRPGRCSTFGAQGDFARCGRSRRECALPSLRPPNHRTSGGCRRQFCEDQRLLALKTLLSSEAKRAKRRFDFFVWRNTATFSFIDSLKFFRRGVIDAGAPCLNVTHIFSKLLLVFWRPGFNLLKELFGAWAHQGNIIQASLRRHRPANTLATGAKKT